MSVLFPNVPNLPGVPQLARAEGQVFSAIQLTGAITSLFGFSSGQQQWGIVDANGDSVLTPDSYIEFEHHPKWRVSTYPVQGTATTPSAFASYDKVKLPAEWRMRCTKGGNLSDRQTILNTLDSLANTIALYSILTPEKSYPNVDIQSYDIVREGGNGAFWLSEIDIYFIEIIPVTAQYSTTQLSNATNTSAIPQAVNGNVAAQVASQYASLASGASLSSAFGAY